MASVTLERVSKSFEGGAAAVADVSLAVADGEFVVLVGPSGCGKTTLLRIIAGLERPSSGRVLIGGEDVTAVPPQERDIAMVFQSYALYPTMSVRDNIGFGLRMRGVARETIRVRVEEIATVLGLTDCLDRTPDALSGGQRQRVAMGRAIVRDPRVFLMDEPLSNLDAQLRTEMRAEVARIQRELGATTIYVTHDQTEAMTMGDRVVVLRDGRVQQLGAPTEVYDAPANVFVATFTGNPSMNLLSGRVVDNGSGPCWTSRDGSARVPLATGSGSSQLWSPGRPLILGIRPEQLDRLGARQGAPECCLLRLEVAAAEVLGGEALVYLSEPRQTESSGLIGFSARRRAEDGPLRLIARLDRAELPRVGELVEVTLVPDRIHLFDPETGQRISG